MFNLEQAIAAWRQQMIAGGVKTPTPLDELESHLRDDVDQQLRSGINPQQAFQTAAQRIGQAHALKTEFEKTKATSAAKLLNILLVVLLAAMVVMANIYLIDSLQALYLAEGLLLSLVLPIMTGMHSRKYSVNIRPLLPTVWTGQALIALGGLLIILLPHQPILGLIFALISCVVFVRKLRRQMRTAVHPTRLVAG